MYESSLAPIQLMANWWIQNAFMNCIPGLNVYSLLTVDLLHEVELGVWKGLFTHIIHILSAHSPNAVGELDRRYAHCPLALLILSLTN